MAWHTFRRGWREMFTHPGVALLAILTLALGIGGSTTMYSMLSGIGLGIGPVAAPDRVGRIFASNPALGASRSPLSVDEFFAIQSGASAFQDLAAYTGESLLLEEGGTVSSLEAMRISPSFFHTLGFELLAGRSFRDDECRAGAPKVAIVSERFSRKRWDGPAGALGRTVRLAGADHTIVGVLPGTAWFPAPGADVWTPLEMSGRADADESDLFLIGRLRSAATWERARAELRTIGAGLAEHRQDTRRGWSVTAVSVAEDAMKRAGFGLFGLLGPAVVVLLIACSNVANLLLARGVRREREMAIRLALGASRGRLVRERLAESAWLAAGAGAIGIVFAFWGTRAARAWLDRFKPGLADGLRLDPSALAFAVAVTALTPLLFGLVPALITTKPKIAQSLHETARHRSARKGPYGVRDLLVIVEMALAVVLVLTAGLFGAFVWEMNHIERGFDAAHVLAVGLDVSRVSRTDGDAGARRLVGSVLESVRAVPGVSAVTVADRAVPIDERPVPVTIEGCKGGESRLAVPLMAVGPAYFAVLGLPILQGRGIDAADVVGAPAVAVVSEALARRCWEGRPAVGRQLRLGDRSSAWTTVVGVARNAMSSRALGGILGPPPVYLPAAQRHAVASTVLIRADGDVLALAKSVRRAVWSVDGSQPLADLGRVDDAIAKRLAEGWMMTGLMQAFAGLALALAAIGVFGVTSYSVAERTREFGIRVAMGAKPADILRLVMARALTVVAIGTIAAAVMMIGVTRVMWAELLNLGIHSPMGFVAIAAILASVAVSACLLPARRATRADPVVALRAE